MVPESADYALEMENLTKRYGLHEAVRGVTLGIRRGEFFGLLGPNGAGKTTIIGMLCVLIEPTRGCIRIAGRPAQPRKPELKRMLGLVPQDLAFYPTLSARENLAFFGTIFGLRGRRLRARIDAMLDIAQLGGRELEPVSQYSGGMKRRLNVAIGLLHEPDILILDEPTVGVDAHSRNAILQTLETLNRDGKTVVYSTHYMEEAQRLCGRLAIIDRGQVIALDSPENLIRSLGRTLVEVEFTMPLAEPALRQFQRFAVVEAFDQNRCRVRFEASRPEVILQTLFEVAAGGGPAIRNLRVLEPGLETVFLRLTGRQMRD